MHWAFICYFSHPSIQILSINFLLNWNENEFTTSSLLLVAGNNEGPVHNQRIVEEEKCLK